MEVKNYPADRYWGICGFYVLEETRINGMNYLLVTDSEEEEDGECYILKDVSKAEDSDAVYEFVENDDEMDYLLRFSRN